jgi:hypothetical protein
VTRSTIYVGAAGRRIDLLNPRPADINFIGEIAEHLAKEPRYNGGTPGVVYSVAQHLGLGIEVCRRESDDPRLIPWWLIHDAPEAFLRDDTTPKKHALAAIAEEKFGVLASQIIAVFDELTARFDRAIAEAAGLDWPCPPEIAALVHRVDRIMLVTEWRDLMPHAAPPFETAGFTPMFQTIVPWSWKAARNELAMAFATYLPALNGEKQSG